MPTIPAELPMHLELIQKLLMFVSHMYIVFMHWTVVPSYNMYQHDILIGFSELNQGLACQVVKALIVPLPCLGGELSVFK